MPTVVMMMERNNAVSVSTCTRAGVSIDLVFLLLISCHLQYDDDNGEHCDSDDDDDNDDNRDRNDSIDDEDDDRDSAVADTGNESKNHCDLYVAMQQQTCLLSIVHRIV